LDRIAAAVLALGPLAAPASFLAGCAGPVDDTSSPASDEALVGGSHDPTRTAAGYLVHGPTESSLGNRAACGATLIAPNVVVTAAHCISASPGDVWAFGTGDIGSDRPVVVANVVVHPEFHAKPTGSLADVHYYLRNNDVAYAVLVAPVGGVEPAALPKAEPAPGCDYSATGYSAMAHLRVRACVELNVTLGDDPIFEVHPADSSALCQRDGDEGSPLVRFDGSHAILVGFYVGSVTQGLTDCRRGTQFLDGYESAAGFASFFQKGIDAGRHP
jgi:hypothetical protein